MLNTEANSKRKLSGSEALYGFCGWLTTRPVITKMGDTEECGGIPDLIEEFCKVNDLPPPENNWNEVLKHPST
jgi:hypothetical protein